MQGNSPHLTEEVALATTPMGAKGSTPVGFRPLKFKVSNTPYMASKKKAKEPELFFYKKVIKIPIYGGNFIILFSNDPKKIGNIIHTHESNVGYIYAMTFHNFLYGAYESFAVCFNFWDINPITMGTIVHEVTHAGNRVLANREVIPDWENDEAECYLKGWMADEVAHFMTKCGLG